MRLLLAVSLLAIGCSGSTQREICNNGIDDDGNGTTDCADSDCAGQASCDVDAGYYGTCGKCGQACTNQSACAVGRVIDERPIPQCTMGKCQLYNQVVQMKIDYNTMGWGGITAMAFSSVTTRWILKRGRDGSAVTCATVTAASSMSDPSALETNGNFAMLGYDVTKFMGGAGSVPMPLQLPYVYVGTGSDYVLFTETWTGTTDPSTHLATGTRRSVGCLETGPEVAPIVPSNDCAGDAGTMCRTLRPPLPVP